MKILFSAYACRPHEGSEPGVGWAWALQLAKRHEVWVLTRQQNAAAIQAEIARNPVPNLHFEFFDIPRPLRAVVSQKKLLQVHYYCWQRSVGATVRALHAREKFDLVHHVTYVRYWMPAVGAHLENVPFVWGPVGGAERTPGPFRSVLGWKGRTIEAVRSWAQWLGEHDPLVRKTARRATVAFATTNETAGRVRVLGVKRVELLTESGMTPQDLAELQPPATPPVSDGVFRVVSMGRLLHWKGFEFGLRGFAKANLPTSEYIVIGDGPEKGHLQAVAKELGIADRVVFKGKLPRAEAMKVLQASDVLVHPSLHDSGGWVCLEAMASKKPVICLDCGGPGTQVTADTGFKIAPDHPTVAIAGIAGALQTLHADPVFRQRMGEAGRRHVETEFGWAQKLARISRVYDELVPGRSAPAVSV